MGSGASPAMGKAESVSDRGIGAPSSLIAELNVVKLLRSKSVPQASKANRILITYLHNRRLAGILNQEVCSRKTISNSTAMYNLSYSYDIEGVSLALSYNF